MVNFIAGRIEKETKISLEAGQEKYRAYFINTTLYASYKDAVDKKLKDDGYGDVIVKK